MRAPVAIAAIAVLMDCGACGGRRPDVAEPGPVPTPWCMRVAFEKGGQQALEACWSTERLCLDARATAIESAGKIAFFTGAEIEAVGACWEQVPPAQE